MKVRPLTLWLVAMLPVGISYAADFPAGSYTAHKNVTILFDQQGSFHVTQDGKTQVSGQYRVKGDMLELIDKDGPWACTQAGQQSGTYQWKSDDAGLTLTKVNDPCKDRVGTLATSPWKPQH